MSKGRSNYFIVIVRLSAGIALLLASGIAAAVYDLNFQRPVTSTANELLGLHNLILIIISAILVIVYGVVFFSIIFHRKSRGYKAAKFRDNTILEIIWTIIPFAILVAIAIPSTAVLLRMYDTSDSELTVKITGYQWKWKYDYPEQRVGFFSTLSTPRAQIDNREAKGENYLLEVDNPMVLPVGKKVRFLITANDVIHSWWIPQFGTKKDAIPGFINEFWTKIDEPGIYRGQCTELCGKDHGFMPIVVKAVSEREFRQWASREKNKMLIAEAAASKTWTKAELIAKGEKVYQRFCVACHGPTGAGLPGVFPALTGGKITTGPVSGHLDILMNGSKTNPQMAAFKNQLDDVDIAAVVTYERNALGNNTGDVIQPSQVKILR